MSRTIHPILIVDDDAPTQMLLETLMQRYGYGSVTAANGRIAIDLLRGGREFTAIILDLMMPHVGGLDVIDFLSRQEKRAPVIVCTAAGPEKTSEFDPDVVAAVLRKPFDIESMMTTLFGLTEHGMPSTVLIADADLKSRFSLKSLVAPAEPLEAATADDALALIRERRPDVVIASEGLAARLLDEAVPVVVISEGSTDEALRQRAAGLIGRSNLSRQTLTDALKSILRRG